MHQQLCPRLIGRAGELDAIRAALDGAITSHGHALFVVGEAGIGKSRLAREAADLAQARRLRTLRGRAVEGSAAHSGAYRALAEALLSSLRQEPLPDLTPELRAFQPILARLIPEWREPGAAPVDESLVVFSEAVLRLLRAMIAAGRYSGALLILEDLHWADAETIEVVEYLAANVSSERLVILATTRPESSSRALLLARAMATQRIGTVIELGRLAASEVEAMASACLNGASVPANVSHLLENAAEGLPLLVEDLLAAWSESGVLVQDSDAWHVREAIAPMVPMSFAETVRRRLRYLGPESTRVLRLAALLGRRFEWTLLPDASEIDADRILAILRSAVDAQLLSVSRAGFAFRHALTRDALLEDILPAERTRDSARLLRLVESAHPELDNDWCELAAMLAEAAEDRPRAASLLLRSGRDSLARGALATSEQTLRRARTLVSADSELWSEISRALLEVFAESGKYQEGVETGTGLLRVLENQAPVAAPELRAEIHLILATAAVSASHLADAAQHLQAARELDADGHLQARIDSLDAHVAADEHRVSDAERFARSALGSAERRQQIDVACEALLVMGRLARGHDLDLAAETFQRARSLAAAHRKTVWLSRALHELGTIDMFRNGSPERLLEARAVALESGALATAAWVDGELSALFNTRFEMDRSLEYANSALAAGRRYRLLGVQIMALAFIAEWHAYRRDRAAVERSIAELQSFAADDAFVQEVAWECRAIVSLLAEDRKRALRELERGVEVMRAQSAGAPTPSLAMWVLLQIVDTGNTEDNREELRKSWTIVNLTNRGYLAYADAIARGRESNAPAAVAFAAEGDRELRPAPWYFHLGRRLLSEAAIEDGWGEPLTWLRESEAFFEGHGYDAVASGCRSLLRKAGATTVHRRAHRSVPSPFRERGVTDREMEVLSVLAEGLSNRDIGARLYLSPKTVEKHVASLLSKLGVRTRAQLASLMAAKMGGRADTNWAESSM